MNPDAPNPFDDVSRRGYDHDAVERFPWPVVAGYGEVHRWMDAGLAVHAAWQLRDVWEAFLKFLAAVAVADRLAGAPADDSPTRQLLAVLFNPKGLSLGHWVRLMEFALKETPAAALRLPALKELLFPSRRPRLLPLFDGHDKSFLAWRNRRFGHGVFGRSLAAYADDAREYLDRLHDAFDLCRDLLSAMTLESDDPAGGPLTWGCQSPLPFYHAHQPSPTGTAVHEVRLRLPGDAAPLDLGPLLSVQPCEVCGQWSAFFFDGFDRKKGKAFFLDLLDGHPNKPREHARLTAWYAAPRAEEAGPASGPEERREPAPERFRDFNAEFEPPVYLAERLAAFMQTNDRGVWLLSGPGGVGKSWVTQGLDTSEMLPRVLGRATAVLRASAHGPKTPSAAELLAELRTAAKAKDWYVPNEVDAPTADARLCGWLAALMRQNPRAAELLVVLDGLDELPADGDAPALLPPASALPPRCYLILASRPQRRAALEAGLTRARSGGPFKEEIIGPETAEQRAVLRRYAVKQLVMPCGVDDPRPLPAEWADGLIDRAGGSFLYVFHYCRALQFGVYGDVAALPTPSQFYPAFFAHLRARVGERAFDDYYARVLALLAAAGEPMGLRHLEACGLERGRLVVLDDLADLLRSRREPGDEETLYTLGHAAIEEFVRGDAEWRARRDRENRFLAELTVRRFGDDWYAVDPFDAVESFLLFTPLKRVPATPEEEAETWAKEMRERLYGDERLADACLGHGNALKEMLRSDRSLVVYSAAVILRRDQVERQGRNELANDLAAALSNRGVALTSLNRPAEALADCREAVDIRRGLVRGGQAQFANDLASALNNRCSALRALNRTAEALADCGEATDIRRALVRGGQAQFANDLASALNNRGGTLVSLCRPAEALADYGEAMEIYGGLMRAGQAQFASDLAMTLNNRAGALRASNRPAEALANFGEAMEIYRGLVRGGQAQFANHLATALLNRALLLEHQQNWDAALADYAEAIALRESCVKSGMAHFLPPLLLTIRYRLMTFRSLRRWEDMASDVLRFLNLALPVLQADSPPDGVREEYDAFRRIFRFTTPGTRDRLYAAVGDNAEAVRKHIES